MEKGNGYKKVTDNKKNYIDLLLPVDESEDMIDKYFL